MIACDYDCFDFFMSDDELTDSSSDKSEELTDECILCYETCYHSIKCETCHHSYCKECFKKLIETNEAHPICAYCCQSFSKTFIDKSLQKNDCYHIYKMSEKGCHEFPFDMDDKVIKCKHCHERFEYGVLKAYFMAMIKCNPDYKPECMLCHQEWDNIFMYDNFEEDFCKDVLKLFDPYACRYCQERKRSIHCQVCRDCLKQHFQENGNTFFDCKYCHKVFTPDFMFNEFEGDYCKDVLKIKDPKGCIYCQKRKEFIHCQVCQDCLKQHFLENGNISFDCKCCHTVFTPKFMFDNFGVRYCKDVLKLKDPEGCYPCNDRYHHTYTCKYCNERMCKEFMVKYLKEKYEKKKEFDCVKCHHKYSDIDLYQIFEKETCKKELHLKDPADCIICNSEKKDFIDDHNEKITCPFCYKNICIYCIKHCLWEEANKNYDVHNIDPNIRYVREPYDHMKCFIDDTLHCPHCKHIWKNQYIYDIYKKYVYGYMSEYTRLYIAAPSMLCYKCGVMPEWPSLRCKCCDKVLCQSCYNKIIYEEYGLIDTSTYKYSLTRKYSFSPDVLKTHLRCKECSRVLCKIKLVYSRLCHGNGHYDEHQFKLRDYTISDTYSDYRA